MVKLLNGEFVLVGMACLLSKAYSSGPGCSKLTTSLVNVSLNFKHQYLKYANIFC